MGWLSRFSPHVYAILRIIVGVMFMLHGTQKLFGWPSGGEGGGRPPLASIAGVGGILELVLGAMVAVGLLTSFAAFLASGEMAVAYFMAHAPRGFFPILNKGELAVMYCFVFLYIAAHGAGIWSIDKSIRRQPVNR